MQSVNNLRGVAILLIVFTHAIWLLPHPAEAGEFLDYLIGNGSIVFMFISGYMFSETADNFRYFDYLKNKLLMVGLPYIVTSIPASLLYVFHLKTYHIWIDMDHFYTQMNALERYLYLTVTGAQLGPLWFIPMIMLYFIVSPAFVYLRRSKLLFPIFGVSLLIAYWTDRPFANSNTIQSFVFYIPVFIFGIIIHINRELIIKIKPYSAYLLIGYLSFYVLFYFLAYTPERRPTSSDTMVLYLPLIVFSLAFFSVKLNRKVPILDMFARLSFFIFFIHGYFPGVIRLVLPVLRSDVRIENPFLETSIIFVTFVLILFFSLATYVVLKPILRDKSRYLIGG